MLTGSAATAADRVVHRGLAKSPDDRYATAEAFAADLASALALVESGQVVEARPILRLAVLPFRMRRPDPAADYLGPSLADALASSLTGLESLVVRSTLKTARYSQPPLDLARIAADLAVDVVLTGSLLVSPRQVRVTAELVSMPAGDVWWSHVTDAAPDGVLERHDDIARRVLAALLLSARDLSSAPRTKAANERAFDLYLRGMQLRGEAGAWGRRTPSTQTTAPRSTTTRSSRSNSDGWTPHWRACSIEPGNVALSRTSMRCWSTRAATAACSRPRWRRTAPPRYWIRRSPPACCTPTASEAWRALVARLTVAQTVESREFDRHRGRALLGV